MKKKFLYKIKEINIPFNGLPMLVDSINNGNKKSISEKEKNTARAHGYIQFLKSKLPSQAKVEKVYQETFNKRDKEALEKKTLEKIKTIDINYLKIALKKEGTAIVKELYNTFEIQDLNNEALSCIIDKICYNNTLRDLENSRMVSKDNNVIIRHSYITFKGAQGSILGSFLFEKNLNIIDFSDNILGDTGVRNLLDVLKSVSLYHLILANNSITRNGAGYIAKWARDPKVGNKLKTLNLSGNKLGNEGLEDLSPALENLASLSHLILSYNGMNLLKPASIKFLKNNALKFLDLSHNKFGDEGVKVLMDLLDRSPSLSHFMFSYNANIGLSGIQNIRSLYSIENLEILDLSHCKLTGEKVISLLSSFLCAYIPKKINISHNNIGDLEDERLTIFNLIIGILGAESKLEALDISGNQIGLGSGSKIPYVPYGNSSLRELYAENSGLDENSLDILLSVVLVSKNLESIDIRGNNLAIGVIESLGKVLTSKKSLLQVKINLQDMSYGNIRVETEEGIRAFTKKIVIKALRESSDIIEKIEKSTLSNVVNISNTVIDLMQELRSCDKTENILNGKKINSVLLKEILSRMEVSHDIYHKTIEYFDSYDSLYHPLYTNLVMGDHLYDPEL